MAGLNIHKKLEDSLVTLIGNISYISTNSIPVINYHDNSETRAAVMVMIEASLEEPAVPEVPNCGAWKVPVKIYAISYIADDTDRADLQRLYQEIFGYVVNSLTPAVLTTQSGLSIDGIIQSEGGDPEDDDGYQALIIKRDIYLQN